MKPETMHAAARRYVGFEKAHFARLGWISDIVETDATIPLREFGVAQAILIYHQRIADHVDVLALHAGGIFDLRDNLRLGRITDVDNAKTLIVGNVSVLAVFADAKLCSLVPAVQVRIRQDREVLQLAVARLAFFGAAEYWRLGAHWYRCAQRKNDHASKRSKREMFFCTHEIRPPGDSIRRLAMQEKRTLLGISFNRISVNGKSGLAVR